MDTSARQVCADRLSKADELKLIKKIKKGCPLSARALVDEHKERLFAFVWRIVHNHHDAEEVVQDAFLRAFSSLDTFDQQYRFSTWLFTIAYRLSLNTLRRKHVLTADIDFSTFSDGHADVSEQVADSEESRYLKTAIWGAVDQLTVAQRATVLLFYRENQGCNDIAQILELPVATVKSHLFRARARLREILQPILGERAEELCNLSSLAG